MTEPIVFITTLQIKDGALERFKEAARRSMEFLRSKGPQLVAQVCIDEKGMRAHGIQVHRDSESIITHWRLADPHMRDVMQYATTTKVDVFGQPSEAVMAGMQRLSGQGAVLTVTPHFVGFDRLVDAA